MMLPKQISHDFSSCMRITKVGVLAIAEGCHELTTINLCGCKRHGDKAITAADLTTLAEKLPKLRSIIVHYSQSINESAITAIRERYPQLEIKATKTRSAVA